MARDHRRYRIYCGLGRLISGVFDDKDFTRGDRAPVAGDINVVALDDTFERVTTEVGDRNSVSRRGVR
ncbi:hypothetical protein L836_1345 [Mycobacteroides abscessus MAB_110811_2726]|nr:hypothetical protein L836_1345 [Mycobacteroides abscessus MAB_110811_2726]EUA83195.1 hypothetical protein I544_4530 [Mycobacteroides abscessus subsp. bolletii 103]